MNLHCSNDAELQLGDDKGISVYIEADEDPDRYRINLIISEGVHIQVGAGYITLTKEKSKENHEQE